MWNGREKQWETRRGCLSEAHSVSRVCVRACWHRGTSAFMDIHPQTQQKRLHKQQPQFCRFNTSVLRACAGHQMVIHLLNYRHGHLHTSWSTIRGAGNESSLAIPRLKQGSKWSQVGSQVSCSREETSRLAETRLVWPILPRGTGWAEHPPPFLQFSAVPSQSFPSSGHQALLKVHRAGWDEPPGPAAVRISLLEDRGTGRHGALSGSPRPSLGHNHGLGSVLKINSMTWIYFYISGRLRSRSASQNKAHSFNGILKMIAPL